jgi:hypothetical protein
MTKVGHVAIMIATEVALVTAPEIATTATGAEVTAIAAVATGMAADLGTVAVMMNAAVTAGMEVTGEGPRTM